jgi:hypothetical protein
VDTKFIFVDIPTVFYSKISTRIKCQPLTAHWQ